MRFPEDKIKQAILHPDPEIRDRAAGYFAKSYSTDPSIMPLVIESVQTHSLQDAYRLIGLSRNLRQSEETIDWVIRELNDPRTDLFENYAYNLSMILLEADPLLLLPRETAILDSRHFLRRLQLPFTERLRMLAWDEATCWKKLEAVCEAGKDKQYVNQINLGYARRIVEALARRGKDCEGKIHDVLTQKVDDYQNNPMRWLEPMVVRLAGQAHLESAVGLIIAKLHIDADLLDEECAEALIRIGTPAVVTAVAEAFLTAEHHFRLYATGPMEHICSDQTVEQCLHLLAQEIDDGIRLHLTYALLCQFATEGIEPARQILLKGPLDFEREGLRGYLLQTCAIMEERFPEYDEWLAAEKADKAEHLRRIQQIEGDPTRLTLYALEKLTGKKAPDVPRATPAMPPSARLIQPPRKPEATKKVGRNDACPCGSGKKFKNCCMKR